MTHLNRTIENVSVRLQRTTIFQIPHCFEAGYRSSGVSPIEFPWMVYDLARGSDLGLPLWFNQDTLACKKWYYLHMYERDFGATYICNVDK